MSDTLKEEKNIKLDIRNICKVFDGKTVLKGVDLKVMDGEFLSILGVSGSGKSTLLKTVCGIKRPDAGEVFLNGKDITHMPMNKRDIVIVHQDALLFPHMSVAENIGFSLRMKKKSREEIRKRVSELLKIIELKGYEDNNVNELSGGERQRVALARAVASKPEVLLLDEPYNGMDSNLRIRMREFTKDLVMGEKITTILVTHDKEEAFMLSDRVAIMENGEIGACGAPQELYRNPGTVSAARFLGYENFIRTQDGIKVIPVEAITIERSDDGKYEVLKKSFKGSRTRYIIKNSDDGSILGCEMNNSDINEGSRVRVSIEEDRIFSVRDDKIRLRDSLKDK